MGRILHHFSCQEGRIAQAFVPSHPLECTVVLASDHNFHNSMYTL